MIKITQLAKRYKTKNQIVQAVKDVNMHMREKEIYALLGPNGAGKTTTMRMISTLTEPSAGKVTYGNVEPDRKNLRLLRKNIGFLTNEIRLDGQFSPNELADFYGKLYGLSTCEIEENKKKLFGFFGITEIADRNYGQFSTGMKQKTSLAISMIHNPSIVLFDEPTNGLDILTQLQVEEFILKLKAEGKCIVVSTHILDVVEKLADRVGVIVDGKSVFEGTKEEMKKCTDSQTLEDAFVALYKDNHSEEVMITSQPKKKLYIPVFKRGTECS